MLICNKCDDGLSAIEDLTDSFSAQSRCVNMLHTVWGTHAPVCPVLALAYVRAYVKFCDHCSLHLYKVYDVCSGHDIKFKLQKIKEQRCVIMWACIQKMHVCNICIYDTCACNCGRVLSYTECMIYRAKCKVKW